ncbi:MAG: type II secretion system protein [Oscillospiraceae bacterium]|nr:type II secretion system protein [Oscillospiraceae bacterium]MBQ4165537.1 type II secretion system protein [Oscillospiraceae bacterium]
MIRYFQNLKAKKGFTMVELIIVVAIIGVLIAIVAPLFSSDQARRDAADIYASDCYSGLQYNFTRYQKTEAPITPQLSLPAEQTYLKFNSDVGGNVLTSTIYIEIKYDQGIKYVHVSDSLFELTKLGDGASSTAFEKLIENDMNEIINGGSEGYYYAKVTMDPKHYNLKVMTVHFIEARLPEVIGSVSDYKTNNLHFIESALLSSGYICGTCSSEKNSTNGYVGGIGSYFMNL